MRKAETCLEEWEQGDIPCTLDGNFALLYEKSRGTVYKLLDRNLLELQKNIHWFRCGQCDKVFAYKSIPDRKRGRIQINITDEDGDVSKWYICQPCWFELKGVWAQEEVNKALEACYHARSMCSVKSTDST